LEGINLKHSGFSAVYFIIDISITICSCVNLLVVTIKLLLTEKQHTNINIL